MADPIGEPDSSSASDWTIRFVGYHPVDDRVDERLRRVCEEIHKVPASALHVDEEARLVTVDYSQVRGWFEATRQFVHSTRVGDRLVVKPPWEQYEPSADDIVVEIEPGGVFGSGLHETTQVSLQALEKHLQPGGSVIDFGTGSGVLAIAAAKLGASRVIAFDISPEAVETARANVLRNGIENLIEVFHAEDSSFIESEADLVIANVTQPVIVGNSQAFAKLLKTGGRLIVAGVCSAHAGLIEESLHNAGFEVDDRLAQGDWIAIAATKKPVTG